MNRITTEMPSPLIARFHRGVAQSPPQGWFVQEEKDDPANVLRQQLGEWLQEVSKSEALFQKFVYENNDLGELDLRQHRSRICGLISMGEMIAVGFILLGKQSGNEKDATPNVATIDQSLEKLFSKLIEWHGSLATQSDIPESFKQATQEVEMGKLVNLDI